MPAPLRALPRDSRSQEQPSLTSRSRYILYALIGAIFAGGMWLRGHDLSRTPLTGDEAESAINAMTILQTGLPRGEYLGIPIYENVLTEPWPGHEEYEFRDSSYSSKGLAIYHGWLPLYSMAVSMKAFGVTPDQVPRWPAVQHSDAEIRARVAAARVPAVIFGAFFMLFLFLTARAMFGMDAGVAALLVGAFGRPFVLMAREARYHSATLALTTACCYTVWRIYRYNLWRDYLLTAGLLTLLFYTHLLAFIIAAAIFALVCLIVLRRQDRRNTLAKGASVGLIVAALAAPWVLGSGFLEQTTHIPPARVYLSFPADLLFYPLVRVPYLILPALGVIWLAIVVIFHHKLPAKVTRPLDRHHRAIAYLLAWIGIGIIGFTLLIPAASYFYKRLTLAVMGPGVVWGAILFAAAARAWWRERSVFVAPAAFLLAIVIGNMGYYSFLEREEHTEAYEMIARLRTLEIAPDTRIYCTPNDQLTLTYLTGLPVQSVAPVRKRFIDQYAGPMLIIDTAIPHEVLTLKEIRRIAAEAGYPIDKAEAQRVKGLVSTWLRRQELPAVVGMVQPPAHPPPAFAQHVAEYQKQLTRKSLDKFYIMGSNNPLLRAYQLRDWSDWWPLFFYRFVDPQNRMRENLNYARRIRTATAELLDCGWVIYHCPPLTLVQTDPHLPTSNGSAPVAAR